MHFRVNSEGILVNRTEQKCSVAAAILSYFDWQQGFSYTPFKTVLIRRLSPACLVPIQNKIPTISQFIVLWGCITELLA